TVDPDDAALAGGEVVEGAGAEPTDAVPDEVGTDLQVVLGQARERGRVADAGGVERLEPGMVAAVEDVGQDLGGDRAVGEPPLLEPGGDEGAGAAGGASDVGHAVGGDEVLGRPAVLEGRDVEVRSGPPLERAVAGR